MEPGDAWLVDVLPVLATVHYLICVTMFGEDARALSKTMSGIARALQWSKRNGGDMVSDNTMVVLVQDGVDKLDHDAAAWLTSRHLVDAGALTALREGITTGGVCQHSSTVLDGNRVQVVCAIKQTNRGKVHSQDLAMQFCRANSTVTLFFLLDVGTVPHENAMQLVADRMAATPNLGGVSGHIRPEGWRLMWPTDIVKAFQAFEYESALGDKGAENAIGLMACLAGAFSCYRVAALLHEEGCDSPWHQYQDLVQKARVDDVRDMDPTNMWRAMAEDRLLGLLVAVAPGQANLLGFVSKAVAETDIKSSQSSLRRQRRRWLLGALFAVHFATHSLQTLKYSNHSFCRKVALDAGQGVVAHAAPALMGFAVHSSAIALVPATAGLVTAAFGVLCVSALLLSLVEDEPVTDNYLQIVSVVMTAFTVFVAVGMVHGLAISSLSSEMRDIVYGLCLSQAPVLLSLSLYKADIKLVTVWVTGMLWQSNAAIVLIINAICNSHQIAWDKQDEGHRQDQNAERSAVLQRFRLRYVMWFLGCNVFCAGCLSVEAIRGWPLYVLAGFMYANLFMRITCSIINKFIPEARRDCPPKPATAVV